MVVSKYSSFYFTAVDPDYSIKGSRDPLGFQTLWQHQGRKLIPYLSTVSSNLQDFQIMCLAYHFYDNEPDTKFVKYFLRFEQLMAYVRLSADTNSGFNGVDKVRKKIRDASKLSISNLGADEILSNQRAYGIWGKYNRPFQEIGISKDSHFSEVFQRKIDSIPEKNELLKIVKKIRDNEKAELSISVLDVLKPLLIVTNEEKQFFSRLILEVTIPNPFQNQLLAYIKKTALPNEFNLYKFLEGFDSSLEPNSQIRKIVADIRATERILSPLNRILRYLQTKPHWTKQSIEEDKYISKCKVGVKYNFTEETDENKVKNAFIETMFKDNWNLVTDLVSRNSLVTDLRGGSAWLTINKDLVEIHHSEGGFIHNDYNPEIHYDNGYFIDTYLHLYRQINK